MSESNVRVRSNLLSSALGYIVSIAIGLILPRFFTVTYGSEVNGLLTSVNQFVVYLSLFEAGIGTASIQALFKPVAEDDKNQINAVMNASSSFYRKVGLHYLLVLVILCLVYPNIAKSSLGFFTVAGVVFFTGIINVMNFWIQGKYVNLLQAEGKNYIITNLTSISTILTGVMKIVMISLDFDIVLILFISFCINLATMLFVVVYIKFRYSWLNPSIPADFHAIEQKDFVLIHQVSTLIFNNADIVILTVFCGLKVVSVYSMYRLVINQIDGIASILPNSVDFSFGQLYHTHFEEFRKRIDIFESLYSVIYHTLFSVTLFLFIPFMGFYTKGITDINYVDYRLAFLFVAMELLTSERRVMNNTIFYAGHFKSTTSRTITETVINIAVSLVCVYYWGIYGTLVGTIVALFYRTNDIIIYSNRRLLKRSPLKTYSIHFLNLIWLIACQFLFKLMFPSIDSIFEFLACGTVSVLVAGLLMLITQCLVYMDFRTAVFDFILSVTRRKVRN